MATLLHRTLEAASSVPCAVAAHGNGAGLLVVSMGTSLCVVRCEEQGASRVHTLRTFTHTVQLITLGLPSIHGPQDAVACLLALTREGLVKTYTLDKQNQLCEVSAACKVLGDAALSATPSGCHVLSPAVRHRHRTDHLLLSAVSTSYDYISICSIKRAEDADAILEFEVHMLSGAKVLLAGMQWQGPSTLPRLVTHSIRIKQMAFLEHMGDAVCDASGSPLLCILSEVITPGGPTTVNLDCVSVNLLSNSMSQGAWSCRNIHPTTALITTFPGSSSLPSGLLVASSRSLQLITTAPAAATLATQPPAPPAKQTLLQYALPGLPTSLEAASPTVYLVGDNMGNLHLISLSSTPWITTITTNSITSIPSTLRFLPAAQTTPPSTSAAPAAAEGALFVGSTTGNSQLLSVPAGTLTRTAQPVTPPTFTTISPAAIPSAAPIVDAITVPSGHSAEEQQLVLCSGSAPSGRLLRSHLAAGLEPYVLDGPELPGSVQLFALPARHQDPHHSLLAFSFDSSSRTDVLRVTGDSYSQELLQPGVDHGAASLLLARMPGDWLLQATSSEVRVVGQDSALVGCWKAPGHLTLAQADGSTVLAVAGAVLHSLQLDPATGALAAGPTCDLPQQASALGAFTLPAAALAAGGSVSSVSNSSSSSSSSSASSASSRSYVGVGLWLDNSVLVLQQGSLATVAQVHLGEQQPRSVAAGVLNSCAMLFVGTIAGQVLFWQLQAGPSGSLQLVAGRRVQVSNTAVQLQLGWLPQHGSSSNSGSSGSSAPQQQYVYAHAGSDAIFSSCEPGLLIPEEPATQQVQVSRVHGTEQLRAACPLHTPSMPHSVAWVSPAGRLCFGGLDTVRRLRWSAALIGDTPLQVAHHGPSRCLVLLTESVSGQQWLRLVDQSSLKQLAALRLEQGHFYTAVASLQLPCSSQAAAEQARSSAGGLAAGPSSAAGSSGGSNAAAAAAGCKEFVVLASYLLHEAAAGNSGATAASSSATAAAAGATAGSGLQRTTGVLSVFDVQVTHDAAGAGSVTYKLQLLGTHATAAVPMSLCTAVPAQAGPKEAAGRSARGDGSSSSSSAGGSQQADSSQQAASGGSSRQGTTGGTAQQGQQQQHLPAEQAQPYLLAGCEDGMRVFRVFVDDAGTRARAALGAAVDAVCSSLPADPMQLEDADAQLAVSLQAMEVEAAVAGTSSAGAGTSSSAAAAAAGAAAAAAAPRPVEDLRALSVAQVCHAQSYARGVVSGLVARGASVFASDFMGSLTVSCLTWDHKMARPLLVPRSVDRRPLFTASVLPLTEHDVLVGVHPSRLLWLYREGSSEQAQLAAVQRWQEAQQEAGVRLEELQRRERGGLQTAWGGEQGLAHAAQREMYEAAEEAAEATRKAGHSNGWFTHRDLCTMPDLSVAAGCNAGRLYHRLLPGRLGLHSSSVEGSAAGQHGQGGGAQQQGSQYGAAGRVAGQEEEGNASGSTLAQHVPLHALAISVDGAVAQLTAAPRSAGRQLLELSEAAEVADVLYDPAQWPGAAEEELLEAVPTAMDIGDAMAAAGNLAGGLLAAVVKPRRLPQQEQQELEQKLAAALELALSNPAFATASQQADGQVDVPAFAARLCELCSLHRSSWECWLPAAYAGEEQETQPVDGNDQLCMPVVDVDFLAEWLQRADGEEAPGAAGLLKQLRAVLQG